MIHDLANRSNALGSYCKFKYIGGSRNKITDREPTAAQESTGNQRKRNLARRGSATASSRRRLHADLICRSRNNYTALYSTLTSARIIWKVSARGPVTLLQAVADPRTNGYDNLEAFRQISFPNPFQKEKIFTAQTVNPRQYQTEKLFQNPIIITPPGH